jgi:UrcA family protein
MSRSHVPRTIRAALAGAMLIGAAAPVLAQDYYPDSQDPQEDIIVNGRWGRVPDDVQTLSQRVSYADLDLRYSGDRRELRHRVEATARYLCDRLGENDGASSLVSSCRDAAVRDAMRRVGTADAGYAPRDTAWVGSYQPYQAAYEPGYP